MSLLKHYSFITRMEKELGIYKIPTSVKKIYAIIDGEEKITTAQITRHWMMDNTSLSTIKRAILLLIDKGLIEMKRSDKDRREKYLTVKKV